ncbi:unnamed protein product [Didymodactylos carnosus]|nr:unnamed protein product [Didymodactylos carnosus]CAF4147200.1 unnamed protein product [Didymodactylos carnosus]
MSDSSQERSFDRSIQNGKHKKSMDLSLRPDDKIRHQKSIKAFDPQSTKRVHEQESIPTSASKTIDKNKAIKNFDPKSKPEFIKMDPTTKYISGSQSEPVQSQQRATSTNKNVPKPKVEKLDPKLKKPIVSAKKISASEDETPSNIRTGVKLKSPNAIKKKIESSEIDTDDEKQMLKSTKINSTEKKLIESTNKTAEGTREQTNIRQSSINHEPKIVPKPKTSTDITAEQMLPSVPKSKERSKDPTKDSMIIDEQDDLRRDRKEKSVVIEKKTERKGDVPSTPERTLTPTSEPEEVKENMLVKNNDRNESLKDSKRSPLKEKNLSKTSETIKPTSDNESPIKYGTENHDQGDATDKAQFFKWLDDQSRAIIGGEKSTGRQSDKKASNQSINQKTSEQSPSPEDIYKPPFGPKISTSREQIKDKEHEPQPTSTKTDHIKPEVHDVPDNDVDEFFS